MTILGKIPKCMLGAPPGRVVRREGSTDPANKDRVDKGVRCWGW